MRYYAYARIKEAIISTNRPSYSLRAPFLALKASAGSGKTFALSARYIMLLFQGARAHEILALTFTKKATKEMQERIQHALRDLAQGKQGAMYDNLLKEGFLASDIAHNAPRIYRHFLHDRARILTFDAFFRSMLMKFSYFVGLRTDFLMSNTDISAIMQHFLESIYSNANGLAALVRSCKDLDLEFGALFMMLKQCFTDKIHFPPHLLTQYRTWDEQALHAQSLALQQECFRHITMIKDTLIHAGNVLNKPLSVSGKNALAFKDFDEFVCKKRIAWLEEPQNYKFFRPILSADSATNDKVSALVAHLKQCMCAYFYLQEKLMLKHIAMLITHYDIAHKRALQKENILHFDDVALRLYDLLVGDEGGGVISPMFFYFRLDTTIAHILIDEFQDTSPMQYRILEPLIAEICAGVGVRAFRSFFLVGDSKQSIYGFRGSDSALFDVVTQELALHVENLPYNYRSYSVVVDFVNSVFARIFDGYIPQQLPSDSDKYGGFVRVCVMTSKDKSEAEKAFTHAVIAMLTELFCADVLAEDIAILCYTNADALYVRDVIKAHFPEVTTLLDATAKITDEPRIKALLCALELAQYVACSPMLSACVDANSHSAHSMPSSIPIPPHAISLLLADDRARFALSKIAKLLGHKAFVKAMPSDLPPSAMYFKAMHHAALAPIARTFLRAFIASYAPAQTPSRYVLAFMRAFRIGDSSAQLFLQHSLESSTIEELFLSLAHSTPNAPNDFQHGLRILTIHKSKGLEFPYVIVLDRFGGERTDRRNIIYARDGMFIKLPKEQRRKDVDDAYKRALEHQNINKQSEKNNVLYVACTRAQKGLILLAKEQGELSNVLEHIGAYQAHSSAHDTSHINKSHKHICNTSKKASTHSNFMHTHKHALQEPHIHSIDISIDAMEHARSPYFTAVLESGSMIPSIHAPKPPSPMPIILSYQHFGTQTFLSTEQESFSPNSKSVRFGAALHAGLEYHLGYGVRLDEVAEILFASFGLEASEIKRICERIYTLTEDRQFQALQARMLCASTEIAIFTQGVLQRLDVLAVCYGDRAQSRDNLMLVVLDYKSGASSATYATQVRSYIHALAHIYGDSMECEGYIIYMGERTRWERISK